MVVATKLEVEDAGGFDGESGDPSNDETQDNSMEGAIAPATGVTQAHDR